MLYDCTILLYVIAFVNVHVYMTVPCIIIMLDCTYKTYFNMLISKPAGSGGGALSQDLAKTTFTRVNLNFISKAFFIQDFTARPTRGNKNNYTKLQFS